MRKTLILIVALVLLLSIRAIAGETLDRFLNTMMLDVTNSRSGDADRMKTVATASPVGQTFTVGENMAEVSRIAVGVDWWTEAWAEDESLVLTLWDSPSKTEKLGSQAIPYRWRAWEGGVLMFTINSKIDGGKQYYFELTVDGGDGTIPGISGGGGYTGGQAYEDGKPVDRNIWFEIHSRPVFNRDAAYADRFSNWNLDYPGLEKVKAAVNEKKWDEAVDALIAYYESREEFVDPKLRNVKLNPDYDTSYADMVLDMKIKDDEGNTIDLGPNWNHYRWWRTRGSVGLTRSGLRSPLAGAYHNTGDEKYANAFNGMVFSFMDNLPNPLRSGLIDPNDTDANPSPKSGIGGGSMGGSIGRSTRMNQMWYYYSLVADSTSFTRDVRAAMIFDMVDSANTISAQKGGGNRAAIMASALYEFGDRHPELKRSREWFNMGIDDLFANLMDSVHSDGVLQEPTYNYHCLTVNRYTRALLKCKGLDIPVKPEWKDRTEKALDFIMYSVQPDWKCPARGDTYSPIDGVGYLDRMADYYNRPDFHWVGSYGKDGRAPFKTSASFPQGGYFITRSDWSPDALYMNIRNGRNGSHGHADHNSITLYAHGRSFIIDPGVYQYGTSETKEMTSTRSHATVTVDNRNTNRPKGQNTWASFISADYFSGTNSGYSGLNDVKHNRKIIFLNPSIWGLFKDDLPGYWMMVDTVTGTGEHNVTVRFPFENMSVKLRANGDYTTLNQDANLLVRASEDTGFVASLESHPIPWNDLQLAPRLAYTCKSILPLSLPMLLFPYKGNAVPDIQTKLISNNIYSVAHKGGLDYLGFGSAASDAVEFVGEAFAVRADSEDDIRSLVWVNGQSLSLDGKPIALAAKPLKHLELIYANDTLTIVSSYRESSLEVNTLGAAYYRINGSERQEVKGDIIKPFK